MDPIYIALAGISGAVAGIVVGFFLRKKIIENKISSAEETVGKLINEAKKEADTLVKGGQTAGQRRAVPHKGRV